MATLNPINIPTIIPKIPPVKNTNSESFPVIVTNKIEPIQNPNKANPKAKALPYIHNIVRILSHLIIFLNYMISIFC